VTWSACALRAADRHRVSNRGTIPIEQPIIVSLLLIYIVVIGGVFIFMTSRGNRKRQTQASQLQSALAVGAEVRTIGGMVGEVIEVTDEHVVIETTPGVQLKFVKSAIAGVIPPAEPEEPEADSEEDDDAEPELGESETAEPADQVPALESEADKTAEHAESEPAKR
jgi:preprotein translocase subunit YajC